jgi:osmoprotectant transport system permease protein
MNRIVLRLLVALLLLAAGAGGARASSADIRVGSKRFTESYVLAEIVCSLARAEGVSVLHERGLGGTAIAFRALEQGSIDAYVEYTGTLAQTILGRESADVQALREALAARKLRLSSPLGFENTYALAVRGADAKRLNLRTVGDLAAHPGLRVGLSHEFVGRSDGWPGLAARYGLHPGEVRGLDHALAYEAIGRAEIDVLDVYTTDAKIARLGLTVLEDDRHYFPPYDAVLVYRDDVAPRAPAFERAVAKLAGAVDAKTMQRLNARAEIDAVPADRVAAEYLGGVAAGASVPARGGLARGVLRSVVRHGPRHMGLVVVAVLASSLVGVPLGLLAFSRRRVGTLVLGLTGVFQTIPSLALFCFLIPLFGIGATPALVALFLYGLLPVVRNTHAGLASVPPELRETAHALGLSAAERLRHVELPLASRTILAGVKTSAVVAVGTATIAAFIGAGGLGEPIATGLSLGDTGMILEGALPSAGLALVVQALFDVIERLVVPKSLGNTS